MTGSGNPECAWRPQGCRDSRSQGLSCRGDGLQRLVVGRLLIGIPQGLRTQASQPVRICRSRPRLVDFLKVPHETSFINSCRLSINHMAKLMSASICDKVIFEIVCNLDDSSSGRERAVCAPYDLRSRNELSNFARKPIKNRINLTRGERFFWRSRSVLAHNLSCADGSAFCICRALPRIRRPHARVRNAPSLGQIRAS